MNFDVVLCREFSTSSDGSMSLDDFKRLSLQLNYQRFYKLNASTGSNTHSIHTR